MGGGEIFEGFHMADQQDTGVPIQCATTMGLLSGKQGQSKISEPVTLGETVIDLATSTECS